MALQSSGAISLQNIATEFGGTAPHSISEYYGVAAGIPASGAIDFADFYGASASSGAQTGTVSIKYGALDDNNSSTYLYEERRGFGLTSCSDFIYPESSSPYYCGFGCMPNHACVFNGGDITMLYSSCMLCSVSGATAGTQFVMLGVCGTTNNSWVSMRLCQALTGCSFSETFLRCTAAHGNHHRLCCVQGLTVKYWLWTSDSTLSHYDCDVTKMRTHICDYGASYGITNFGSPTTCLIFDFG
jgi:hypothetical protein